MKSKYLHIYLLVHRFVISWTAAYKKIQAIEPQ